MHAVACGHFDTSPHAPEPVQLTSHAHDIEHSVWRWHDISPVHDTLHGPALHWMTSPHADAPVHSTSHDRDEPHCT